MKKQIITTTVIALFATGIIFSCKKKETTPEEETSTTTTTTTGTTTSTTGSTTGASAAFMWQENGGAVQTTTNVPKWTSYGTAASGGSGIRVNTPSGYLELNWNGRLNLAVGTKTGATLYFGTNTSSSTQQVSITSLTSDSLLSGNFNIPFTGGTLTSVSGTFTGAPKY